MTRKGIPIWQAVADALTGDLRAGRYRPGDRLPTGSRLAARFGVNRHTVRRALARMAQEGLVHSRRGAGVFVDAAPTDYPLSRRVRFHANLRAAGREPAKEILSLETCGADAREARALGLEPGDPVHVCEGLALADSRPVAVFRSAFPGESLPGLPEVLAETRSTTEALALCGVADYTRSYTRVAAKTANATQARQLRVAVGAPILRSEGVDVDPGGSPVEYGIAWFAGDRVALVLEDS